MPRIATVIHPASHAASALSRVPEAIFGPVTGSASTSAARQISGLCTWNITLIAAFNRGMAPVDLNIDPASPPK